MEKTVQIGSQGVYRWLTSAEENMNTVLRLRPEAVVGKYVAITTYDSGVPPLSVEDENAGWLIRNGIAYGPKIRTPADLPELARIEPADLYQEWYVFPEAVELGRISQENVFISRPPGQVVAFVNYFSSFQLDGTTPEYQQLTALFWEQINALQPESYFGEGEDLFTFVTRDPGLFERVLEVVRPPVQE